MTDFLLRSTKNCDTKIFERKSNFYTKEPSDPQGSASESSRCLGAILKVIWPSSVLIN